MKKRFEIKYLYNNKYLQRQHYLDFVNKLELVQTTIITKNYLMNQIIHNAVF